MSICASAPSCRPARFTRTILDPADLAFDINLSGQVGRYLADAGATPPEPDSAAAFFIGLNDYAEFAPTSPETALAEGTALVQAVVPEHDRRRRVRGGHRGRDDPALHDAELPLLPPVGIADRKRCSSSATNWWRATTRASPPGAALLQSMGAEVEVHRHRPHERRDPGRSRAPSACAPTCLAQPVLLGTGGNPTLVEQPDGSYRAVFPPNPVVAGVDPDQLGFLDFVHPTAAVHGIWGVFSADSLDSETFFFGDADDTHPWHRRPRPDPRRGRGGPHPGRVRARTPCSPASGTTPPSAAAARTSSPGARATTGSPAARGCDVLADGAGADLGCGGRGSDLLIDGTGFDILGGGRGNDALVFVDATLRGGTLAQNGGVMFGGAGFDTAYLILEEDTRSAVAAELRPGAGHQALASIGLELFGIERVVLLDPEDAVAAIATPAPLDQADLWGLI